MFCVDLNRKLLQYWEMQGFHLHMLLLTFEQHVLGNMESYTRVHLQ